VVILHLLRRTCNNNDNNDKNDKNKNNNNNKNNTCENSDQALLTTAQAGEASPQIRQLPQQLRRLGPQRCCGAAPC